MHAALVSGDFRSFHRLLRNLTEAEEDAAEVRWLAGGSSAAARLLPGTAKRVSTRPRGGAVPILEL